MQAQFKDSRNGEQAHHRHVDVRVSSAKRHVLPIEQAFQLKTAQLLQPFGATFLYMPACIGWRLVS
jgi:hypothetical protein